MCYVLCSAGAGCASCDATSRIRELEDSAWKALCNGDDDVAERINRELCEARVEYAKSAGK